MVSYNNADPALFYGSQPNQPEFLYGEAEVGRVDSRDQVKNTSQIEEQNYEDVFPKESYDGNGGAEVYGQDSQARSEPTSFLEIELQAEISQINEE